MKPVQVKPQQKLYEVHHVHPREHDFISYKYIGHYYDPGHHCFGYRVMRIPSRAIRLHHHHHVYYCYNGVYYRPYGSYYVVCRPPLETILEWEIAKAMNLYRCKINYYYSEARRYDAVYQNNRYIDEQYEIMAKNNEIIAQQNAIIAKQNSHLEGFSSNGRLLATDAFNTAQSLGLVQSYANANAEYYYQDGIFYLPENGKYKVITPPAGALVEYIPDDYDVITLKDGNQYYQVDETVYKVTVKEGVAYFEVMGQLYK